jgi:EmrB/QacA subfamily drug resistance transporter
VASFVAVADTTIVTIALPSMRRGLGFSGADAQWILNGYALTFGGLLLLCGRAGDLFGRRRLFLLGLTVFGLGSLLAGLAWDQLSLVAGRLLQGLGAAGFVPASLSLLTATFTDDLARNRAIGSYGAMAALGFVVGMVGGGVITELWGWRWVLLVNVPVVMATIVMAGRVLDESREPTPSRSLDVLGAVAATGGMSLLIYALSVAPEHAMREASVASAAAAAALLAGLVVVERRHHAPLVSPDVVRRRPVLVPNLAISLQSMIGIAWLYVLTVYFQDVLGHGALEAGLLFVPMTVASVVAAPLGSRLASSRGVRLTAVVGMALVAVGLVVMTFGMGAESSLPVVISGMAVGETGFMFSNVALTIAGTAGVGAAHGGLAAGLLNTSIQLGSALGLAVVAAVVATTTLSGPNGASTGLRWGMATCLVFCLSALALVGAGLRSSESQSGSLRRPLA